MVIKDKKMASGGNVNVQGIDRDFPPRIERAGSQRKHVRAHYAHAIAPLDARVEEHPIARGRRHTIL
jgi:hypothetical protein